MAAVLALILTTRPAHADCAVPRYYTLKATGNTVAVCEGVTQPPCTPSTPFLRQDEATGEVVSIAATCGEVRCFNDECVPPGTYRYGLASLLVCSSGCDTVVPYFAEVSVTAALSNCTRDPTSPAPMATTVNPPWGTGNNIVASFNCPGCSCGMVGSDRDRGKILAVDFLVAAIGLAALIARRRRAPHRT